MAIDKIFNDANVDGIADNIFGAVNNSVSEVKQMQQRKAAENVQMVVEAFKKIETNITEKFDNVTDVIEKRVLTIKDGRDGSSGSDGRNGRDGKPGRDGVNGKQGTPGTPGKDGVDGEDGVSVTDANIDFDGSLVISLSSGQQINVGEVVAPDLAEKIKIVSTMSTNGAVGIKDEGTSITAGVKVINFVGATVTATNSGDDVTVNVSAGTGTVQSVAATVPAFLSVAGSPITTTGTLAISLSGTALPVANGGTGLTTGTSGGVLAYTATGTLASSAALAASALVIGGGAGAAPSTTTTGTGVVTALGVNTGTAGAFVVNGGALGTPSSGTLTSATGLPISTGVSGLGTGIATALAVNVGTAGAPVVNGGALGSPSTAGTMPAFTLGGTVSGGGNQINNVIIGTTGAAAGNFTTVNTSGIITITIPGTGIPTNLAVNTTAGAANGMSIEARADESSGIRLVQTSTTYNTSPVGASDPPNIASAGTLVSGRGGGLNIVGANGPVRTYSGGASTATTSVSSTGLAVTGTLSSTLDATIQGVTVGLGAGAVATNTAVGVSALAATNTGAGYSVGVGYQALQANTSGEYNVAVGGLALKANDIGSNNSAFGLASLLSNTSGSANTAYGRETLNQNTTASNNTAVGYQAAYTYSTGGGGVVAIGRQAGYITNAAYGVYVGQTAGYSSTGVNVTHVGFQAGYYTSTGVDNTSLGWSALQGAASTSTGSYNTALGSQALFSNTTASYNTAVGYQAGYTNVTGAFNVFVGGFAGQGSTGSGNTFIGGGNNSAGYPAGFFMTGGNSVVIGGYGGNQDSLDIRTSNNYVVLATGNGDRQITMAEGQTLALDSAVPNSGTGITFPATQSASSNANTLDDYEEGTWTPSIGGTATYSVQNGTYTKIGRVVTLHCYLGIADLNTGSTTTISGAPFSCASYGGDAGSIIIFNTGVGGGNFVFLQARIGESASTITFSGLTAAASSSTSSSTVFGTNATMAFTLTYFV